MMKKLHLRLLFGTLLGAMGGASMTVTVFPYATSWFSEVGYNIMGVLNLMIPVIILWIIGGAITAWFANTYLGGVALGCSGVVSGFILATFGAEQTELIFIGSAAGLLYGCVGGLMVGAAFANLIQE